MTAAGPRQSGRFSLCPDGASPTPSPSPQGHGPLHRGVAREGRRIGFLALIGVLVSAVVVHRDLVRMGSSRSGPGKVAVFALTVLELLCVEARRRSDAGTGRLRLGSRRTRGESSAGVGSGPRRPGARNSAMHGLLPRISGRIRPEV